MFETSAARPLFPTYLWTFDLPAETSAPLNRSLTKALHALTPDGPALRPGSTWQTDQVLHRLPDFQELMRIVNDAAQQVLDTLEVRYEGFAITGCWANLGPPGAPHQGHTHPNNYLSGVYYVRTPSGGDSINFHDPRPQTDIISPPVKRRNQYNSAMVTVPVREGRVIIFPAWLGHSVLANRADEVRISISFNIMFTAFAETIALPKWQGAPVGRRP